VELPAFAGNPHLDIEEIVKGDKASELKQMVASHGLIISALANHPEGQIVLGPYGKDTDAIYKGTKEEKIKFGTERMIKTAQAANALEVPVVTGFLGCENFGRFFPWPYSKGWADMEMEMVERWGRSSINLANMASPLPTNPIPMNWFTTLKPHKGLWSSSAGARSLGSILTLPT
jgi:sugar phosphate isomerase/epimerase